MKITRSDRTLHLELDYDEAVAMLLSMGEATEALSDAEFQITVGRSRSFVNDLFRQMKPEVVAIGPEGE